MPLRLLPGCAFFFFVRFAGARTVTLPPLCTAALPAAAAFGLDSSGWLLPRPLPLPLSARKSKLAPTA